MRTRWIARWRRAFAAVSLCAMLAGTMPGPAAAAAGSGGAPFSWPLSTEITTPSGRPEMAQRQALGCSLVGLGVTGVAIASGALATAGSGGTGVVPLGSLLGEIVTYFGAGCTIGAFLAGLFPPSRPTANDVGG